MSRLAPKSVKLEERERKELKKIVARHSTSQQVVKRGEIVLLASEGNNHRLGLLSKSELLFDFFPLRSLYLTGWGQALFSMC